MSKLIIESTFLQQEPRLCTTWTEHKHSHGQEGIHVQRNTAIEKSNSLPSAAATEFLYTHKNTT